MSDHYVEFDDVREMPGMGDEGKYPDTRVEAAIEWLETKFEEYTGMAFLPRTHVYRVTGDGGPILQLLHYPVQAITSVRIFNSATDVTTYTSGELAELVPTRWGEVRRYSGRFFPWSTFGAPNIEVTYVHGQD